jgi:hypothetical protein
MAIKTSLRFLAVLLLIAVASADPASADPVLVNAGSFSVHSGDPSLFDFIGNGFNLPGDVRLFGSRWRFHPTPPAQIGFYLRFAD